MSLEMLPQTKNTVSFEREREKKLHFPSFLSELIWNYPGACDGWRTTDMCSFLSVSFLNQLPKKEEEFRPPRIAGDAARTAESK